MSSSFEERATEDMKKVVDVYGFHDLLKGLSNAIDLKIKEAGWNELKKFWEKEKSWWIN